jgi:orotate phosphoribosyltransferase
MSVWLVNYLQSKKDGAYLGNCLIVLTSGMISDGYINQRILLDETSHRSALQKIGKWVGDIALSNSADMIVGPVTMGAVFARYASESSGIDYATIDLKQPTTTWSKPIQGKKVLIVDDTLTTGKSIKLCVARALADGATVVGAAVTIRRERTVGATECGLTNDRSLYVMEEINFSITTQNPGEDGTCELLTRGLPMRINIGHAAKPHQKFGGKTWIDTHPNYPLVG